MNRAEFIIVTAIVLFVAFGLGWFASWVFHRFSRATDGDIGEIDHMAQELHDAEEARDAAIRYLEDREADLSSRLTQTEAELRAAMDGLRNARHEAEELRAYIERTSNGR